LKIILAGKTISGKNALRVGLVDRLFPQAGLENFVFKFIEEIKEFPDERRNSPKKVKASRRSLI